MAGRKQTGQVVKAWRKRDQQYSYALRLTYAGERITVRLGMEVDGWNDYRAKIELDNIISEIEAGTWRPPAPPEPLPVRDPDPTFHEFATFWLDERRHELDEHTIADYTNLLCRHLLPWFHKLRLTEIDYESIRAYRTSRLEEGERRRRAATAGRPLKGFEGKRLRPFGARQVNASVALLAQILDRAVRSEAFTISGHPARERDLKVRRVKATYRRYLEADEVLDVLRAALALDRRSSPETLAVAETVRKLRAAGKTWTAIAAEIGKAQSTAIWLSKQRVDANRGRRAMLATLALCGLRNQEVAELRWRHIDFTHGRIVIEDAKSPSGVREVHLSPFLREELVLHRIAQGSPDYDALVFPTKNGTVHTRHNVNNRVLAPAVERAEKARRMRGDAVLPPQITPHTLRRTFVTLSAQLGRSAAWVASQIGHADMTTMQRYYLQASSTEISPRIRALVDYLLGEGGALETGPEHQPFDEAELRRLLDTGH